MKVAVFSTPRTSSSYTIQIVSNKLKLKNYNELYDQSTKETELTQLVETKLYNTDDYAIKFMAAYFKRNWLNFEELQWERFDHIIFTERTNVTDQLCSWYLMRLSNTNEEQFIKITGTDASGKFISKVEFTELTIEINQDFINTEVEGIVYMVNDYHKYKKSLIEKFSDRCITFTHELFHKTPEEYLNELNLISKFNFTLTDVHAKRKYVDYTKIFTNYDELENKVTSFLETPV